MKKTKSIPAQQIGFVCASLPEHMQYSINQGHELRRNGSGYEIWIPERQIEKVSKD